MHLSLQYFFSVISLLDAILVILNSWTLDRGFAALKVVLTFESFFWFVLSVHGISEKIDWFLLGTFISGIRLIELTVTL